MDKSKKELEKKAREKALKESLKKEKQAEQMEEEFSKKNKAKKKTKKSAKNQYFEEIRKEKRAEENKVKNKKKKKLKAAIIAVTAVVVLAVPFGVYEVVKTVGIFDEKVYFAETEHFKITPAQMSYYFDESYSTFLVNYSEYLDSYGIDENTSPKEQIYDEDTGQTWFEYLMEESLEPHVEQMLTLCEGARDEGIELSDEDIESCKETLASLTISDYGKDATEKEIYEAIKLENLAQNYYNHIQDSFDYTEEQVDNYYNENEVDFLTCDYQYMTFSYSTDDDSDENTLTEEEAYEFAEEAAKCKTEDEFDEWILNYANEQGTELDDEELQTQLNNLKVTDYDMEADDAVSEWAMEDGVKKNDTKIFNGTDSYSVVMLLSEPERDTSATYDIRLIYLDPELSDDTSQKAEDILEEFKNQGSTEDSFSSLAKVYSNDSNTKYDGGLYEDVSQGYLIESLNDWVFDESRKEGDTEIIDIAKGTYILYFIGESDVAWHAEVKSAMVTADYEDVYNRYLENYPTTFLDNYDLIIA